MNIGIHVDSRIEQSYGGGYTYSERIVESLRALSGLNDINYVIVYEQHHVSAKCLEEGVVTLEKFKFRTTQTTASFFKRKQQTDKDKKYRKYASLALSNSDISLMYYPHQHRCISMDLPYIVTNWDLAHITSYAFPELSGRHFDIRKAWYDEYIHRALLIFAESQAGKRELMEFLNIPEDKIKVIPMFPGKVVDINVEEKQQQDILLSHNLEKDRYFLYPAQFWAVKNHHNLVKAFSIFLSDSSRDVKLVLTGLDKGNLDYIKATVANLNLTSKVLFPGFVESEVLKALYMNAISLVFPTLLGPTNMPIVEALSVGCPVICSDFEGHREQAADAALYVNPMNILEISEKMKLIFNDHCLRKDMSKKGLSLMQSLDLSAQKTAERLHENFLSAKKIINLWQF